MGGEISAEAGEGRDAPGGGGRGPHRHPPDPRPAAHAVLWPTWHWEDHHRARHCLPALRGINVVRTTIKDFATVAAGSAQKGGYPCPPYKIIILHEADLMTEDAQNVLGHIVETHSKVTRFFFICNYISRIREPIASRCAKFRFKPLPKDVLSNRILHICNEEGLTLGAQALSTLSVISKGDVRRAITYLQSAACLFGSSISPTELISISMIIEKISSEVKDLSGSKEIPNHLKGVSSRANEVVDEISSNVKDLSARSEEMTNHLKDLSSRATEILEIKIEDRAKRDLLEERRQKVTEDMATYLKEISLKSLSSRADEKHVGVSFGFTSIFLPMTWLLDYLLSWGSHRYLQGSIGIIDAMLVLNFLDLQPFSGVIFR